MWTLPRQRPAQQEPTRRRPSAAGKASSMHNEQGHAVRRPLLRGLSGALGECADEWMPELWRDGLRTVSDVEIMIREGCQLRSWGSAERKTGLTKSGLSRRRWGGIIAVFL